MKSVAAACSALLLTLAVGLVPVPSFAGEAFAVKTMEEFLEYQYALREAVESGEGRFATLTPPERSKLIRAQDDIFRILARSTSVKRLSDRERRDLYNAQHVVAAIVTDNRDDRSTCRFASDLGTHLQTVQCRTVAESEAIRRDNSQKYGQIQRCRGSQCGP